MFKFVNTYFKLYNLGPLMQTPSRTPPPERFYISNVDALILSTGMMAATLQLSFLPIQRLPVASFSRVKQAVRTDATTQTDLAWSHDRREQSCKSRDHSLERFRRLWDVVGT